MRLTSRQPFVANDPVALQREYYRDTAGEYDRMHRFSEHYVGLRHVSAYLQALGASSLLDTGCGTGLAMRYLKGLDSNLDVHGNDPSLELLEIAVTRHGIPKGSLDCAGSEALPYEDRAFDVVVETGMLHHVPHPDRVIAEMLRVARKAIFLSDTNTYGLGPTPARVVKLLLAQRGLLGTMNRLRRGGKEWYYGEGDGVAWNYSVFTSMPQVRRACAEVLVIPTGPAERFAAVFPLLFSSHCVVAGFKEPFATRKPLS